MSSKTKNSWLASTYQKYSFFSTEKTDGMFATVIIVLPSQFTGGTAHLEHGGITSVVDCSSTSLTKTTVISWYTDVTHEIKPITSGYRLALSYNLIHTTSATPPAMPAISSETNDALRHTFHSWKHHPEARPLKIMYLLKHRYAQAGLKGAALKGVDTYKHSRLNHFARQFSFHLGLASVECHISGMGDDNGGRRRRDYWGGNPDMVEVYTKKMTISHLVDLDGELLTEDVCCLRGAGDNKGYVEGETIPVNLRAMVESAAPDKEEYEGYQENVS